MSNKMPPPAAPPITATEDADEDEEETFDIVRMGVAVHDPVKNGAIDDAATLPLYPELHVQLDGTSIPAELAGHKTATHDPL